MPLGGGGGGGGVQIISGGVRKPPENPCLTDRQTQIHGHTTHHYNQIQSEIVFFSLL